MKSEYGIVCACVFLIFSGFLQGCDFGEGEIKSDAQQVEKKIEAELPKPPPAVRKAAAQCKGGHFHCDGEWREWCSRMEKRCKKDCAPMCAWTCDSPQCNQQCGPVCNQPICSTRCKGFNTDSCKMKCGKPMCKVVCPKHFCPSEDCAACKTECGKPACRMECGSDEQPCRHVCAQPVCKWECKNPQACPKPKCEMKCKKAPDCMQKQSMFSKVPPLEPGETEIVNVNSGPGPAPSPAAASFLSTASSTLRVNFTRMEEDHSVRTGQVDLALVQVDVMDEASAWSREVNEHFGKVTENEAYCLHGNFHCRGDATWCSAQKNIVCSSASSEMQLLQRQARKQTPLQP